MSTSEDRRARVAEARGALAAPSALARKLADDVEELERELESDAQTYSETTIELVRERDAYAERWRSVTKECDVALVRAEADAQAGWRTAKSVSDARNEVVSILRALVKALPKCHRAECDKQATTSAYGLGLDVKCDAHPYSQELPYAAPLRAALALLAGKSGGGEER